MVRAIRLTAGLTYQPVVNSWALEEVILPVFFFRETYFLDGLNGYRLLRCKCDRGLNERGIIIYFLVIKRAELTTSFLQVYTVYSSLLFE